VMSRRTAPWIALFMLIWATNSTLVGASDR
jgi:hypothetical protein